MGLRSALSVTDSVRTFIPFHYTSAMRRLVNCTSLRQLEVMIASPIKVSQIIGACVVHKRISSPTKAVVTAVFAARCGDVFSPAFAEAQYRRVGSGIRTSRG